MRLLSCPNQVNTFDFGVYFMKHAAMERLQSKIVVLHYTIIDINEVDIIQLLTIDALDMM